MNGLKKYAEETRLSGRMFEGYDSGTTDFAPFINKIPAGVDAVMGGGHFADGTTLTRQIYEKRAQTKMVALLVRRPSPSSPNWARPASA